MTYVTHCLSKLALVGACVLFSEALKKELGMKVNAANREPVKSAVSRFMGTRGSEEACTEEIRCASH